MDDDDDDILRRPNNDIVVIVTSQSVSQSVSAVNSTTLDGWMDAGD
jgi:hypothetical protein